MSLFIKDTAEILNEALTKISTTTSITATSPGSVARAFTEAIASELGDLYSILDFNLNQFNLSTASGSSLDLIGSLYNIKRKNVTNLTVIDRALGAFYFYIDAPYAQDIIIPTGTRAFTNASTFVGNQFTYATTQQFIIPAGRTKVYASIIPQFSNSVFTAGINTLTVMDPDYVQPLSTTVKCTNPKAIQAQVAQEDDNSYRFRIQQQVRTTSGSTETSVRLTGINTPGVRDITLRDTPYGLGSYECLVTPEDYTQAALVLVNATAAMNTVRAAGVRMYTRLPNFLSVDVNCSIVIKANQNIDQTTIINGTQVAIIQFLNRPLIGSSLVYSQLIQTILDYSDVITDVTVSNLAVNGTQVLFQNYTPKDDEQLVPGTVTVTAAS